MSLVENQIAADSLYLRLNFKGCFCFDTLGRCPYYNVVFKLGVLAIAPNTDLTVEFKRSRRYDRC